MTPLPSLDGLLDVVVEDARVRVARLRDRAANEGRRLILAAEEHVEALAEAARELGRVRGRAAEESLEREGDAEIAGVQAGAFDRLYERFEVKVRTALENLRDTPRYAGAIRAWAASAAARNSGPVDVYAAPEDRDAVFEACLAAGASDFQVHVDRGMRIGILVRDLDGHVVLDRRPDAIVAERADALRALLRRKVPDTPEGGREA